MADEAGQWRAVDGIRAVLSLVTLTLGVLGNGSALWLLYRRHRLRDHETFLQVKLALTGFLLIFVCTGKDIVIVIGPDLNSVRVCMFFRLLNCVMSSLVANAAGILLVLRCWRTLHVFFTGTRRLWGMCTALNVFLSLGVPAIFAYRYSYSGMACKDLPLDLAAFLFVTDVVVFVLLFSSFILQYYKMYSSLLTTAANHSGGRLCLFMRRHRMSLMTCTLVLAVVTASRLPLFVVRAKALAGQTISEDSLKFCLSMTRLSTALNPYVFLLLTRRVRPEFRALLPCSYSRRSVEPLAVIHVVTRHPAGPSSCITPALTGFELPGSVVDSCLQGRPARVDTPL